jgi:hypothetical protein
MGDQAARKRLSLAPLLSFREFARNCDKLSQAVLMTRAELMRHALTQALRKVHVGDKRLKLSAKRFLDNWC